MTLVGHQKFAALACSLLLVCSVTLGGCAGTSQEGDASAAGAGSAGSAAAGASSAASGQASSAEEIDPYDVSEGVAATVNGVQLGERAITNFIQQTRESQGLTSEDAWGAWLIENGYTVDSLRAEVVDYYVDEELVRQAAQQQDITVTDEEVDASLGAASSALAASTAFAASESRYYAKQLLLQQKLVEKLGEDEHATWMSDFKENADIVENLLPEGMPYDIDLTPYADAANASEAKAA